MRTRKLHYFLVAVVSLLFSFTAYGGNPFITRWSVEAGKPIHIPVYSEGFKEYQVVVQDGILTSTFTQTNPGAGGGLWYTPNTTGVITVRIGPDNVAGIDFWASRPSAENLIEIVQFGDVQWKTMRNAFSDCKNLTIRDGAGAPDFSSCTDVNSMFWHCSSLNTSLNHWNMSNIRDMARMFEGCTSYNQPMDQWDVRNVTNMWRMFEDASAFDQNLGSWKIERCASIGLLRCGMSIDAYENTLKGWAANENINSHVRVDATGLVYRVGNPDRNKLINDKNWTFVGDISTGAFVTRWRVEANKKLKIPVDGNRLSILIMRESDGETLHANASFGRGYGATYDYTPEEDGVVVVAVDGAGLEGFSMMNAGHTIIGSAPNLLSVEHFGETAWKRLNFAGCTNMVFSRRIDVPNFQNARNFDYAFQDCRIFNSSLNDWNVSSAQSMIGMFKGCAAFNKPLDKWDVKNVTSMYEMFQGCTAFNQSLNSWDVSAVKDMRSMFKDCAAFNQPLNNWNEKVKNILDMSEVFSGCAAFNQDLNGWDVTAVKNMQSMFKDCAAFNQPLNNWNEKVKNVWNMKEMFSGCSSFNQNLNDWNIAALRNDNMVAMFKDCAAFNQPLDNWNEKVKFITTMQDLFSGCHAFNQDLRGWNVSSVRDMESMFRDCRSFNKSLNGWDVRRVTNMKNMFRGCTTFNASLSEWELSVAPTNMQSMFKDCTAFNQPLNTNGGKWNVWRVNNMDSIFANCTSFNQKLDNWKLTLANNLGLQNCGMSMPNYCFTLKGWAADYNKQKLKLKLDATGLIYNDMGKVARETLIAIRRWEIIGDAYRDPYLEFVPNSITLKKGSEYTLNLDKRCLEDAEVVTFAKNRDIITLDPSSLKVRALEAGEVTVMASVVENESHKAMMATCNILIKLNAVESVALDKSELTLKVGENATLTATVLPTDAENKNVTWSSENDKIATVVNGVVTAVAKGTTKIIVTTEEGNKTAECTVTVNPVVTGVVLSKNDLLLAKGSHETLIATVLPEDVLNKNITWTSEDNNVATVENGVVTGVAKGSTNIVVTTEEGNKIAKCVVTVYDHPGTGVISATGVELNKHTLTLPVGSFETLIAMVLPMGATNQNVTWRSYESTVATVVNGKVTGVKTGKTKIIVTTEDGNHVAKCEVEVIDNGGAQGNVPVTGVELNKSALTLAKGSFETLVATLKPENATNRELIWTTENPEIAVVSGGRVTGVTTGNTKIQVKTVDGSFTAECTVTVTEKGGGIGTVTKVTGVKLNQSTITLQIGASATLVATVEPEEATNQDLIWSSENNDIVTVKDGKITAVSNGNVKIIVTTVDGRFTAECEVFVTPSGISVAVTGIELNKRVMMLGKNSFENLIATVLPADATNRRVIWTTENDQIATVEKGKVTGVAKGTTHIVATTADGNHKAKCLVTVFEHEGIGVVNVTGIELNKTNLTLPKGSFETLVATVLPLGATNQNVSWSSDHPEFVTVKNGKVTGVAQGTAVITVKTDDGNKEAKCTVIVTDNGGAITEVKVTGVELSKSTLLLAKGSFETLFATVLPADATNQTINWSSDAPEIAMVNGGKVYGMQKGTTTIKVVTEDGNKIAECLVTVYEHAGTGIVNVTGIQLNKYALTLPKGSFETLSAFVQPMGATNQNVNWNSEDPEFATVENNGKVTGIAKGTTKVIASSVDGNFVAECLVTVTDDGTATTTSVEVTKLALNKTTLTLAKGSSETLYAILSPANATNRNVVWKSKDSSKAVVEGGRVTGVATGATTIIVSTPDGKLEAKCIVTVTDKGTGIGTYIPVESVTLNKDMLILTEGEKEQLIAEVKPEDATNRDVIWESVTPTDATVEYGLVKAVKRGDSQIRVKTVDGNHMAICMVTVREKIVNSVASVELNKRTLMLGKGSYETLFATVLPEDAANKNVTWSTQNNGIAQVDQTGKVTGVAKGTTTIFVTTQDGGKTAECLVTVYEHGGTGTVAVTGVELNKSTLTLPKGSFETLVALVKPLGATNQNVTWSSNHPEFASVKNGKVTAVAVGEATITVTTEDGSQTATCLVKVMDNGGATDPVEVTGVELNKIALSLGVGSYETLVATVLPANATNREVIWNSQNNDIARVVGGRVTGVAKGSTIITVTTVDGNYTAGCKVTVYEHAGTGTVAVTGVELIKTTLTLPKGSFETLAALIKPAGATNQDVTWSSDHPEFATVENGKVTGVAVGEATITVTTVEGAHTATCLVKVVDNGGATGTVTVTGVELNKYVLMLGKGSFETLFATVLPANATNKNVSWSSENEEIAKVEAGRVIGVAKGTTTITVTTIDGNKSAKCEVNVFEHGGTGTVAVTGVELNKSTLTLNKGSFETLVAIVQPLGATNQDVTWSSNHPEFAAVENGEVTGVAVGEATITVTTVEGNQTATCLVKVVDNGGTTGTDPIVVTGVVLNKTSMQLGKGSFETLFATVLPANATNKNVSWTSKNPDIAMVIGGKVMGIAKGTTTIVVTTEEGRKTDECTVTVYEHNGTGEVAVTGVKLNKNTLTLPKGSFETLVAFVEPYGATNQNVIWSSDHPEFATVVNGKVTGISKGTAIITVTTVEGNRTATCSVTVTDEGGTSGEKKVKVEGIELSKYQLTLAKGSYETLIATVLPRNATNRDVAWSSNHPEIAMVEGGRVTGVTTGEAEITVTTLDGGFTVACAVTVTNEGGQIGTTTAVTGVKLNKNMLTLQKGNLELLVATVEPANATNRDVIWSSDHPEFAKVENGKVLAVSKGTAVITVTTVDGGHKANCTVKVTSTDAVTGVELNKNVLMLGKGSYETLFAKVLPEDAANKNVTWSTENDAIAQVDQTGKVTGVAKGTTTIKVVTEEGNKSAKCIVTVYEHGGTGTVAVTGVELNKSTLTLTKGSFETLVAIVQPLGATNQNVTWSSNHPEFVTVEHGKVMGVAVGEATITVTTVEGNQTATCLVKVVDNGGTSGTNEVKVKGVELSKSRMLLARGSFETLVAKVLPEDAANQDVIWSSENPGVAMVIGGKVYGITKGNTTVKVETLDGHKIAECIVTVYEHNGTGTVAVTGVELNKSALTLTKGSYETLEALVLPMGATNQNVTWTSDHPEFATVENGKVTGVAVGEATITVTTVEGNMTATCLVKVVDNGGTSGNTKVEVKGIELSKSTILLARGSFETLIAKVLPETATNKNVIWTSKNTEFAMVTGGKVFGVAPGTTIITAMTADGSYTAECVVTVYEHGGTGTVAVTGVELNKSTLTLPKGSFETLVALVKPLGATNQNVTWSSNEPTIATVENGRVTALAEGKAEITVTTLDGNKTAKCTVIVTDDGGASGAEVKVTGVELSKVTLHLAKGSYETLFAIIKPENATNREVIWSSDKPEVAMVMGGRVIGVTTGEAHITVRTVDGGKEAYCTVIVSNQGSGIGTETSVMSVELSKNVLTLEKGNSETLVATVKPDEATNKDVIWSTDDPTVATVEYGKVTAVSQGDTKIKVTTVDGNYTAECLVVVSVGGEVLLRTLTVMPKEQFLEEGATLNLSVSYHPAMATYKEVVWSTDNDAVATVDQLGIVTAKKVGEAVITAQSTKYPTLKSSCKITVGPKTAVEEIAFANVVVSPNPFADLLRISTIDATSARNMRYTLLTAYGVVVVSGILEEAETIINTTTLPGGMYLLRLVAEDGTMKTYRIVKQ